MILVDNKPVIIDSVDAPNNSKHQSKTLLTNLLQHPFVLASTKSVKESELRLIRPPHPSGNEDRIRTAEGQCCVSGGDDNSPVGTTKKFVYVFQKEFATVSPRFVEFVGTDEMTTCIGVAMRDPISGMTSVGHFDSVECVVTGVKQLVDSLAAAAVVTIQVHLVGAYDDRSDFYDEGLVKAHDERGDFYDEGLVKAYDERSDHNGESLVGVCSDTNDNCDFQPSVGTTDVGTDHHDDDEALSMTSQHPEDSVKKDDELTGGWSWPLAVKMIDTLQKSCHNFDMKTCCILQHNTTTSSTTDAISRFACPTIRGFVIETSSGKLSPAKFAPEARGPDETVRVLCMTTVSSTAEDWIPSLLSSYQTVTDTYVISPSKWRRSLRGYASWMLDLSDEEFLQSFSTSPRAESEDFVPTFRRMFAYICKFPDWPQTFEDGQPRVFIRTGEGGWERKKEQKFAIS